MDYYEEDISEEDTEAVALPPRKEEHEGTVTRLSSQFWGDWGWCELELPTGDILKVNGLLRDKAAIGDRIFVAGVREYSEKYGESIKATVIVSVAVSSHEGIMKWLVMNLPQIGEQRSKDMIQRFGSRLWDIIEQEPKRLLEVVGINEERLAEIEKAYAAHRSTIQEHLFFYEIGLSAAEIRSVTSGRKALKADQVRLDPYLLHQQHNVSFARVAKLSAAYFGRKTVGSYECSCAYEAVRQISFGEGHTVLDSWSILRKMDDLGSIGGFDGLAEAVSRGLIVPYGSNYQLKRLAQDEQVIARVVRKLSDVE